MSKVIPLRNKYHHSIIQGHIDDRAACEAIKVRQDESSRVGEEFAVSRAERAMEGLSDIEREIFGPAIEQMFGGEM